MQNKRKTLPALLLAAALTLSAGCTSAAPQQEVQNLPELSASSLTAPVPAGGIKDIAEALDVPPTEDSLIPAEPTAMNLEFTQTNSSAVWQDGYAYVLSNSEFMILSAKNGAVELLSTTNFSSDKGDSDAYELSNAIYVENNRLAVVTNLSVFSGDGMTSTSRCFAKIYDISDRKAPVQLADLGQDGVYQDSAVVNGVLYLISIDALPALEDTPPLPGLRDNGADATIPVSRVYVCANPSTTAYTLVSAIALTDGRRTDACAFTDGNYFSGIDESGIYLARSVNLRAQSDSRTEEPYTVTSYATSVVTEIKKLSSKSSLTLLNSYNVDGQALALDVTEGEVHLATAAAYSEYQIFTDQKYGWSNRLDGTQAQKNLLWILNDGMQPVLQSDTLLPEGTLGAVYFSGSVCYAAASGSSEMVRIDLSAQSAAPVALDQASYHHLYAADAALLDLSTAESALSLARLGADGSFGSAYQPKDYTGEGYLFACSEDGANALLYYNGAAHLLRIGEEILESGMPAIGVHSATTILFEGDYLYACAPDSVCAVNLQNAEVSSQLSFGVG